MLKNSRLLLFIICLIFSGISKITAQNSTSSPYSRFGIGDLNSITFARNLSMGGTEIALDQPTFINYGNPAAYSKLWYTTYELGASFEQREMKTNSSLHRTNTASISYFDFAFPVKVNKWSLGFGLLPYSKVGYSISDKTLSPFGDEEIRTYTGSGGLNNFHIGTGFKISKKLSFGVNAEYLFGVINNDRTVEFRNAYYLNSSIKNATSIGWFHFKTGLQYAIDSLPFAKSDSLRMYDDKIWELNDSLHKLVGDSSKYTEKNLLTQEIASMKLLRSNVVERHQRSNWRLVLGLVVSPSADLHARNSYTANSFRYYIASSPDVVLIRDTAVSTESASGRIHLPLSAGFGFSLQKGNRWLFCGDYTLQQWSDFSFLGAADSLVNSWRFSGGLQFIPGEGLNHQAKSYFNFIRYHLGFHYEQTYLRLNGEDINDIGISAGLSLPLTRARSVIHLSLEVGKRGTLQNNLIEERYLKFTLGLTINDQWFIKPKYD